MKVKYRQSLNILSCFNSDFQLDIHTLITKVEGETTVLYDPSYIFKFIDNVFINPSIFASVSDYDQWTKTFLYQGCSLTIENKLYVTVAGFKHFFSSFITIKLMENKLVMDWKHAKFLNWLLKFDCDTFILKANNNIGLKSRACEFCKTIAYDKEVENSNFCKNNSEVINNWRNEYSKSGEPLEETDEQIDFLICLCEN